MLRRAVTRSAGTRIHRKTDAAADNCGSAMLFPGIYNSFELFSRIGGRRYRLSFPARDPGVRRFIRRMRPKAEPEGRWDGSAGEDVPRGHTLCYNPQRRYVRREDQTAEPFVPYRFAARQICRGRGAKRQPGGVRSARKTVRWTVFSEERAAAPGIRR